MFFFVWSNDGGPLQYLGLVLFLLQFSSVLLPALNITASALAPFLLIALIVGVGILLRRMQRDNLTFDQLQQLFMQRSRRAYRSLERDIRRGLWGRQNVPLPGEGANTNRNTERQEDNQNDNANNGEEEEAEIWYRNPLYLGMMGGSAVAIITAIVPTDYLMGMLLFAIQAVAMAIFVLGWHRGLDDHAAGGGRNRRGRATNNLSDIIKTVSAMPVEEYVPEDAVEKCTISQLRKMLEARKGSQDRGGEASRIQDFVERKELVDAVKKCRENSNNSCCICFEEYNTGDPLRVLPKCGHDYHLECIDQWAYTYASSQNRRNQEPSCPLCKAPLK